MGDYIAPSTDNIYTNLSQGSYSPKGWQGSTFDVGGLGVGTLNQIWTDANYVFVANSMGLDIYEITSESKYAYIQYDGGFSTVWGNDERVFVGTSDDGVKYINKTCISGSVAAPLELVVCLTDLSFSPGQLTSQNVKYIHGSDRTVMVVTESGVDVVKYGFQGYHSFTTVTGGTKCFMTSHNVCYYILNQGTTWSLNRVNTCLCDWSLPNHSYIPGSGTFGEGIGLNDMYVTERTSTDTLSNVLFVATTSGVYVIDEGSGLYRIYYNE